MKIVYILNKSVLSGPNIVALTNAEQLNRMGHDVSVLFVKSGTSLHEHFPFLESIRVVSLDKSNLFARFKKLRDEISKLRPDIIHSHCFIPDLLNIGLKLLSPSKMVKHITTVHNIPAEDYCIRYGLFKGRLLLSVHEFLISSFDKVICISETVQGNLKTNNTHVIYNPVRYSFFDSSKEYHSNLVIAYCGHFSRLKNPMKIIMHLMNSNVDFKFLGIGDGPLLLECKKIVETDKRFTFTGRVEDVHNYYKKANCLIHFSQTEGFCLSVAEALASEMYVITNDVPVFSELKNKLHAESIYILNNLEQSSIDNALENINNKILEDKVQLKRIAKSTYDLLSPKQVAFAHEELYLKLIFEINAR